MRILIIGGSSFVGRHITLRAIENGHDVTLFNRGKTNADALPEVERIQGDRNSDVGLLANREWDATIDVCAYVPRQVRQLLEVLGEGAGLYTFISTISVYPETTPAGFDETAPLLEPNYGEEVTNETYGALKVACELTAREIVGDRLAIVRPGYVVGPFDPTGRFTYWVERVAAGGRMLGAVAEQPLQVIDGRDLAAFTVGVVEGAATQGAATQGAVGEGGMAGVFHAAAPEPAMGFDEVLRQIAEGIGVPAPEVHWGGQNDLLPLSDPGESWGLMQADVGKAVAHGLKWRPLGETAKDILEWVTAAGEDGSYVERPGSMLTPDAELEILAG